MVWCCNDMVVIFLVVFGNCDDFVGIGFVCGQCEVDFVFDQFFCELVLYVFDDFDVQVWLVVEYVVDCDWQYEVCDVVYCVDFDCVFCEFVYCVEFFVCMFGFVLQQCCMWQQCFVECGELYVF